MTKIEEEMLIVLEQIYTGLENGMYNITPDSVYDLYLDFKNRIKERDNK